MIKIIDKKDCCGCWACENICPKRCITMSEDSEGFLYPRVDLDACIDCHLCEQVCPEIHKAADIDKPQKAFLLKHRDPEILAQSTSGGAFTAIAGWVINHGGVVFGAGYDDNFVVRHQFTETMDGLAKFRNSKYVQSAIADSFAQAREFLKQGRVVLFTGTPCQLEGLLRFLRKPYDNLVTLDVMCKSVTSPGVFRKYLGELESKLGVTPDRVLFRDKRPYGYGYSQMSAYKDGRQIYHQGVETNEYLRSFFSDMNVRPACYDCSFKKQHHLTDFTIWDCFDVAVFDKSFDDNRGVTRILANSPLALQILEEVKDVARIVEIPMPEAVADADEMIHSVKIPIDRERLFSTLEAGGTLSDVYPNRMRNRIEKTLRISLTRLGLYSFIKRNAKKIIKNIKRT